MFRIEIHIGNEVSSVGRDWITVVLGEQKVSV